MSEPPLEVPLPDPTPNFDDYTVIDRTLEFYPELYPRNPDAYDPTLHFYQRQQEPHRMLTREIDGFSAVRKTIYAGDLSAAGDGCAKFEYDHYGVIYRVIVGFHKFGYRIAVTGYPRVKDECRALDSGEWTRDEIETILEQDEQYGNRPSVA
jgi:hypothetical protein